MHAILCVEPLAVPSPEDPPGSFPMDHHLIERWLRRRVRAERVSNLALAAAAALGSVALFFFVWMAIFVPVALLSIGLGVHPYVGATAVMLASIASYLWVRRPVAIPMLEVTRFEDTGEYSVTAPRGEHWMRLRSRNQSDPASLGSLIHDFIFVSPLLADSALAALAFRRRFAMVDVQLCARAIAVLHADIHRVSFDEVERRLPGVDMVSLLKQLWLLDAVQIITAAPQGMALTEGARQALADDEDAALIASVG
ncbi:MAG: hypothetical protein BroJett014_08960 [Planctomycetota bacterium]|nr:MAG: hypothetical protein BroJett014_08960 [Planctomycetota bacterium]